MVGSRASRPRTALSAVFGMDSKGTDADARRLIPGCLCAAIRLDTRIESEEIMNQDNEDKLREEYDFSSGVRGKHHEAYGRGASVVLLDQDVADVIKDSAAVNQALGAIAELARDRADAAGRMKGSVHMQKCRRGS